MDMWLSKNPDYLQECAIQPLILTTTEDKIAKVYSKSVLSNEITFSEEANDTLDEMIAFEVHSIEDLKLFCNKSRELQLHVRAKFDPNITPREDQE